jgi:hypothetical protein
MSLTMCTALCVQAVAVVLVRWDLGRDWLRRPVPLFVLSAVAYQGLSQIFLLIPSVRVWDISRLGIGQSHIDAATLIMSIGLLVFVICYLATRPVRVAAATRDNDSSDVARILDWRLLALASAPLAALTYEGRGYNSAIAASEKTVPTDLAATFLAVLVVLAAFGFLLQYGMKWFVTILITQSVFLAAAGERFPIIAGFVTLLLLLSHVGLRPSRRQVLITLALTVMTVLGITGYRTASGRGLYHQDSGLISRAQAIGSGFYSLIHDSNQKNTFTGLVGQVTARFDGDSFAGGILQSMSFGHPALGATPVAKYTLIVIPSFAWPSKLTYISRANPAWTETYAFGLQRINLVPTFLGLYFGFLGPYWLMVFLAIMGTLSGWGERWLFRRYTAVRVVTMATAVQVVFKYEQGLPGILVTLRTAVVLAIAVKIIEVVRGRVRKPALRQVEKARKGRGVVSSARLSARVIWPDGSGYPTSIFRSLR